METLKRQLATAGMEAIGLKVMTTVGIENIYCFPAKGGDEAIALWRKLRAMVPLTKFWPVLLGSEKQASNRVGTEPLTNESVAETIKYASTIVAAEYFLARRKERLQEFVQYNEGEDPESFFAKDGDWSDDLAPSNTFSTPFDIRTKKPLDRVIFALVPTIHSWEVPAYLFTGGWNACPEASIHCAVAKYWFEKYGAEIMSATHDVLEMSVMRPPTSRNDAIALARQQYDYCEDIVDQGTETILGLASVLYYGKAWFFWWD